MKLSGLQLIYLVVVSVVNTILAFKLGTDGFEVFLITALAMAVLLSWLTIQLISRLFKSKTWLILKILGAAPVLFLGFIGIMAALSVFDSSTYNPQAEIPKVNAILIILGVVPYLVPRFGFYKKSSTATEIGIGIVATFISILVLYMAFMGFNDPTNDQRNLVLVIAVQLQLLMNYLVVRTNYIIAARAAAIRWCINHGITDENSQSNVILAVVGLPFLIPTIAAFFLAL